MSARSWRLRAAGLGTLACLVLATSITGAWESSKKWPGHVVQYWINPANDHVTNAQAIAAIRFGADAWTDQTKAAFRFAYQGTTALDASNAAMDGKNVVSFADGGGSAHATAYTFYNPSTMELLEADIAFWQDAYDYITGSMPCTASQVYIENVAIHEFGHCLGLDHSSVSSATMWPTSGACSKTKMQLDADDILGVETLYPCSANSQCNDADICTTDTCQNKKCVRTATAGCCTANSQCNDGKPCTTDACVSNKCTHAAVAGCCSTNAQCNDNKPCTTDSCVSNTCTHGTVAGCCTTHAECNDSNPCTADSCNANECAHTTVADCCSTSAQCDDGDPCTSDACQNAACVSTAIPGCGKPDAGTDGSWPEASTPPDGGPKPEGGIAEAGVPESGQVLDAHAEGDGRPAQDASHEGSISSDGGEPATDAPAASDGGCSCGLAGNDQGTAWAAGAALIAIAAARRRSRGR